MAIDPEGLYSQATCAAMCMAREGDSHKKQMAKNTLDSYNPIAPIYILIHAINPGKKFCMTAPIELCPANKDVRHESN